jgi:hypothetical protein
VAKAARLGRAPQRRLAAGKVESKKKLAVRER